MSNIIPGSPLRVLQFICSTGFYGAEGWLLALCSSLNSNEVMSQLVVTKESVDHDLKITEKFKELNFKTHEIRMSGRFDVRAVSRLCKVIENERIDLIHTHGYKSDIIGLLAAKRSRIKCVCTPHGFENSKDLKMKAFINIGCRTFKYFDMVAPLSEALCKDVKKYGVSNDNIRYIPNGVDLAPIETFLKQGNSESCKSSELKKRTEKDEFTLGYIGQLIDRKNVGAILKVFERLCLKHKNLKLFLVGEGEKKKELQMQSSSMSCADKIVFKGYSETPLQELLSFDIFIMTSTLEGIPRCLMESMAMGVPIVSYNIPGIDQLIEHGKTGMLANLHNIDSMVRHCDELIVCPDKSCKLSANAYELVRTRFSAHAMAERYTELFKAVCNR